MPPQVRLEPSVGSCEFREIFHSFVNFSFRRVTLPAEITIMQAPAPEGDKKKKKGRRKAYICDDSSDSDPISGEDGKRSTHPSDPKLSSLVDPASRRHDAACRSKSNSKLSDRGTSSKNVILVNTLLLEILPVSRKEDSPFMFTSDISSVTDEDSVW